MRITFAQKMQGNLDRGGQEVRVDLTRRMLEERGYGVEVLTSQTRSVGDVVHFFDADEQFVGAGRVIKAMGVPYVVSTIWNKGVSPSALRVRRVTERVTNRYPKRLARFLNGASRLVALTSLERDRLIAYFGVDPARVEIVPNGVADRFFDADPALFRERFGIEDEFVLNCARLSGRKNQLTMIRALKGTGKKMVFIGQQNLNPEYVARCKAEAGDQGLFVGQIENSDPLLPSAYAAARVFCLPSRIEVMSVAALEAAGAGLPLVLTTTWGSREHFGEFARYVDYRSESEIRAAVLAAWEAPHDRARQQDYFREHYSWNAIMGKLEAIYASVAK